MWTSDQSPVTWTFWKSGEPKGGTGKNCGRMYQDGHIRKTKESWGSVRCDRQDTVKRPVVCEKTREYTILIETKTHSKHLL